MGGGGSRSDGGGGAGRRRQRSVGADLQRHRRKACDLAQLGIGVLERHLDGIIGLATEHHDLAALTLIALQHRNAFPTERKARQRRIFPKAQRLAGAGGEELGGNRAAGLTIAGEACLRRHRHQPLKHKPQRNHHALTGQQLGSVAEHDRKDASVLLVQLERLLDLLAQPVEARLRRWIASLDRNRRLDFERDPLARTNRTVEANLPRLLQRRQRPSSARLGQIALKLRNVGIAFLGVYG
jgi:hypothetical protein